MELLTLSDIIGGKCNLVFTGDGAKKYKMAEEDSVPKTTPITPYVIHSEYLLTFWEDGPALCGVDLGRLLGASRLCLNF